MSRAGQAPSCNGWRAISIIIVLVSHLFFIGGLPATLGDWTRNHWNGVLGVRFFFTISGFLITWLMLKEEAEAGAASLKNFYLRRSLRILPVYLGCLVVLACFQVTGISAQSGKVWLQLLTFTRNFHQSGYPECLTSTHFWSLSVEEHFYLIWPLAFVWLAGGKGKRIWFLCVTILLSIAWKVIALLGCYDRHLFFLFQPNSTPLFFDDLAYGCIGAILLQDRRPLLEAFFGRFLVPVFVLAVFLIAVPAVVGMGAGMQCFGFVLLLLESIVYPNFGPFRILNHRWMIRLGILSYSLYIWQQPVFVLWPLPKLWFLALPAVLMSAWLSYNFLEKPFLTLRAKLRSAKERKALEA